MSRSARVTTSLALATGRSYLALYESFEIGAQGYISWLLHLRRMIRRIADLAVSLFR